MHDPSNDARDQLRRGLGAGAIATLMMTALLLAAPALGSAPAVLTRLCAALRARPLLALAALAVHLGYGTLAGALYTARARRVSLASGLLFAATLWGVAVAIYAPLVGLGFVVAREPALAVLALPAHLFYGVTLGALAPRGEILHPLRDRLPLTVADA